MRTHFSLAAVIISAAINPPSSTIGPCFSCGSSTTTSYFGCCKHPSSHQPPSSAIGPFFSCWSSTTTSCFGCCKHPNSHQPPSSIITPTS
ncbi:hypothetical protein Pyn_36693 [Prunus yedoensis var. nudiflora]|uniref:Secreted protein n=1 Tax=Prunus yedoensis var. nudiflora TaxID=2094558 RepID=A0A314Y1I6_PRUYE|nr:hypothetical protein Pyn_36693 [Prunus yedoensis var. nudiflora]